jgi:hypothetical protein
MRDYRAYILRIDGHRFLKVADFSSDYPDDAAAMNAARQLVDGHDVEVWDGARLVAQFSGDGEMSPALAPSVVFAMQPHSKKHYDEPPAIIEVPAFL